MLHHITLMLHITYSLCHMYVIYNIISLLYDTIHFLRSTFSSNMFIFSTHSRTCWCISDTYECHNDGYTVSLLNTDIISYFSLTSHNESFMKKVLALRLADPWMPGYSSESGGGGHGNLLRKVSVRQRHGGRRRNRRHYEHGSSGDGPPHTLHFQVRLCRWIHETEPSLHIQGLSLCGLFTSGGATVLSLQYICVRHIAIRQKTSWTSV